MKQPTRNKKALEYRRSTAAERKAAHSQLTPEQKLAKLDARLGQGVGAARERARLVKIIAGGSAKPVTKETAEAVFGVTTETKAKGKGARRGNAKAAGARS